MYKYVVGKCHWKPKEQAYAWFDLILTDIQMFEHASEIADHVWTTHQDVDMDSVEIIMNLNDLNKLEFGKVSGVIPGQVIERPYDLQSKLDRVRNAMIARALGMLMQKTVERMPF